jgi:hypothetical protein
VKLADHQTSAAIEIEIREKLQQAILVDTSSSGTLYRAPENLESPYRRLCETVTAFTRNDFHSYGATVLLERHSTF